MDAYEATKIVFSRIQAMDPDNAAKIMGLLLIQDHGEKEMIRLAFGPEALVQSVVLKARKDLGLLPPTPSTPSSPSPFSRQNSVSSRLGAGSGLPSPSSWGAPPVFSRSNSVNGNGGSLLSNGVVEDLSSADELMGGGAANGGNLGGGSASPAPFYGNGDLMDDFQLQDQLSFLNDPTVGAGTGSSPNSSLHGLMGVNHSANGGDLFYSDLSSECRSPSSNGGGGDILFPYAAWGMSNGHHHRSRSCSMADLYLNSDAGGFGGWKPCLYYARGYCKNGSSCRFQHGLADDSAAAVAAAIAGGKMDAVVEQQCQELLLRSKSQQQQQRIGASQLMASAAPFPYASSPTSAGKCMNFLLQQQQQQQQSENQRAAAAAAAAAALMLGGGGDDMQQHKFFGGRSRMMADYAAGMANPGSRQIYLTFPADSTFREEDVSNYFSIYGPVQDVRIPYQQKRMFGFVTFVYPETVKIILAKGNPHFVCDARVLVKPYKEKGKIPDKKHQQQQQLDRGDFSGCSTPTGLDSRDPYDLGSRMLFNVNQEALLRRKLEEQQQAAELQQAIELQSRRFMGLNILDLKNSSSRSLSLPVTCPSPINTGPPTPITITTSFAPPPAAATAITTPPSQDGSPTATATAEDKCPSPNATELAQQGSVNPITAASVTAAVATATAAAEKEESTPAAASAAAAAGKGSPDGDGDFQESAEHNLPDSPFASPTKSCFTGAGEAFSEAADAVNSPARLVANANNINGGNHLIGSSTSLFSPPLDLRSYKSCFLQIPRFSSGHGAVGL